MKNSNWTKKIQTAMSLMSLAVLAAMTSACNNGSGSGTTAPYGGLYSAYGVSPNCAGCSVTGSILTSSIGQTTYDGTPNFNLMLNFYGNGAQPGFAYGATNIYSGQVAATGQLMAQVGIPECGVPPGTYSVQTYQPGTWYSSQQFSGLVLVATGPTTFLIEFTPNSSAAISYDQVMPATPTAVSMTGMTFSTRVQGPIVEMTANGQACSQDTLF